MREREREREKERTTVRMCTGTIRITHLNYCMPYNKGIEKKKKDKIIGKLWRQN